MSTMSSIEDLFAKKDRKKKRAAARLAQQAAVSNQEAGGNTVAANSASNSAEPGPKPKTDAAPPSQPSQSDDGWIEIEDVRGSQVNTGGRTVVEFRRYVLPQLCSVQQRQKKSFHNLSLLGLVHTDMTFLFSVSLLLRHMEEKANVDETATPAEKFSGWGKRNPPADTGNTDEDSEETSKASAQSQGVADVSSEMAFPSLADAAKIQVTMPSSNTSQPPMVGSTIRAPPRFIVDKEKLREKIERRNAADGMLPSKTQPADQTNESSPSAFPSLADASKIQNPSPTPPAPFRASSGGRGRPLFKLDKAKLIEKMEKRNAAPPS